MWCLATWTASRLSATEYRLVASMSFALFARGLHTRTVVARFTFALRWLSCIPWSRRCSYQHDESPEWQPAYFTAHARRAVDFLYKPASHISVNDDGWKMLVAVASAAGTWTDSALHQPGWLITRQPDHPYRLSRIFLTRRWSNQRRYRTSSEWRPALWV